MQPTDAGKQKDKKISEVKRDVKKTTLESVPFSVC